MFLMETTYAKPSAMMKRINNFCTKSEKRSLKLALALPSRDRRIRILCRLESLFHHPTTPNMRSHYLDIVAFSETLYPQHFFNKLFNAS